MKRKITLFVFFIFLIQTQAQLKKQILGVWIKTGMENLDKKVTPEISNRNKKPLKYTFENKNNFFVSVDYKEKGFLMKYKINRSFINLGDLKYQIERINDKELVLVELLDGKKRRNSIRIFFLKEKYFLESLEINDKDVLFKNGRTIHFESDKIYANFENSNFANVHDYLQSFLEGLSKDQNAFAYATFVINKNGKVSDVKIHHHINKVFDSKLKTAILSTNGMWITPTVNEKKISVLKTVSFNYIRSSKFRRDTEGLSMKYQNEFTDKYKKLFKSATELYLKGEYHKSINEIHKIENLTPNNLNLINFKRVIYKNIGDKINFDLNNLIIMKSIFNYLIE